MLRASGKAVLPVGVLAIAPLSWLLSGLLLPAIPQETAPVEPFTPAQEERLAYCGLVARVGWAIHHEQVQALVSRERHPGTVQWGTFDRMDEEARKCIPLTKEN